MHKAIGIQFVFLTIAIFVLSSQASLVPPRQADPGTFLDRAIEMNRAQIQLADIAVNKAQDARLTDFARTMSRDYTHMLQTLQGLPHTTSTSNGPSPAPSGAETNGQTQNDVADGAAPDSSDQAADREKPDGANANNRSVLTTEHQQTLERLSQLSGPQFDRQFINLTVSEHRRAIRMCEQEAGIPGTAQGNIAHTAPPSPGDMAEVARGLLPVLKQQLARAEEIQRQLQSVR